MIHHRPGRLRMLAAAVCLFSFCFVCSAAAPTEPQPERAVSDAAQTQQQPAPTPQKPPQQPQQKPPQQNPPQQNPRQQNPTHPPDTFQTVPEAPQKNTQPAQPQNPNGIQEAKPAAVGANIIEGVDFRGQHKVPQDTLRALIYTKKGDTYDEESLHRDFMALWNTGRFDDIRVEARSRQNGGSILRFVVTERRMVPCPSSTTATSRSANPKFWIASRNARSA